MHVARKSIEHVQLSYFNKTDETFKICNSISLAIPYIATWTLAYNYGYLTKVLKLHPACILMLNSFSVFLSIIDIWSLLNNAYSN